MGRKPKYDEPTAAVGLRLPVSAVEALKASGRPPGEVAAELVLAGLADATGARRAPAAAARRAPVVDAPVEKCHHPILSRIGNGCAACGVSNVKGT